MKKLLGLVAALAMLSWAAVATAQTPPLAPVPTPRPTPLPGLPSVPSPLPFPYYLALGDSLAAGVGTSEPATKGYVGQFYERIRGRGLPADLTLVNLGIPGETSGSMMAPGGQLEKALAEMGRRPAILGHSLTIITLDIGGNDILNALQKPECSSNPGAQACQDLVLRQVVPALEANLERTLHVLREAVGPDVPILVLTLYNPFSGTILPQGSAGDLFLPEINKLYSQLAPEFDLLLVDILPIFLSKAPLLTNILRIDIHPNDEGYRLIVEAMVAALASRPTPTPAPALAELPPAGAGDPPAGQGAPGRLREWVGGPWAYLLLGAAGVATLVVIVRMRRWG